MLAFPRKSGLFFWEIFLRPIHRVKQPPHSPTHPQRQPLDCLDAQRSLRPAAPTSPSRYDSAAHAPPAASIQIHHTKYSHESNRFDNSKSAFANTGRISTVAATALQAQSSSAQTPDSRSPSIPPLPASRPSASHRPSRSSPNVPFESAVRSTPPPRIPPAANPAPESPARHPSARQCDE